MTVWRSAPVVALVVAITMTPAAHADVRSRRLFSFSGLEVDESSGLVDRGSVVYTNNDSGDGAVVYGIDPRTGRTVSRTTYAASVHDVEAIAPGAHGTLWAGDIGDNLRDRRDVAVYRMLPRDGRQPSVRYPLAYPGGPRDAETLLVQPRTQRVFVVSKTFFGGTVYIAPRHLSTGPGPNRLRRFARVSGLVTDGTFFPDGRHVLLRTYGTATVYTFPGFEPVRTVDLPDQPQGEGISVSSTGRVLVSSEGVHSDVLQIRLPRAMVSPAPATRTPTVRPTTHPAPTAVQSNPQPRETTDWGGVFGFAVAGAVVVLVAFRGARRRGPRRP